VNKSGYRLLHLYDEGEHEHEGDDGAQQIAA
jgi:hypothetical protein